MLPESLDELPELSEHASPTTYPTKDGVNKRKDRRNMFDDLSTQSCGRSKGRCGFVSFALKEWDGYFVELAVSMSNFEICSTG